MKSLLWIGGLAIALGTAADVAAQIGVTRSAVRPTVRTDWYRGGGGYGGYGYSGYGGYSSTPFEGAAYGAADIIRARGENLVSTTDAMINYEQARSAYMDNKLKWTQIYWERKRIGEAERDKDYQKKREGRDKYLEWSHAQPSPDGLSPGQLDPSTGSVQWPLVLQAPFFDQSRKSIENLFALRATTNSTYDLYKALQAAVAKMQGELKSHLKDFSPGEYAAARKFLDQMVVETQMASR